MVLPTGSGKSIVQAAFIAKTLAQWPGERFLLLSHVKELLVQNAEKLRTLGVPVGLYSAGLGRRELDEDVTIAGIQSIYRRASEVGRVSIVIIDEAHLVSKTGGSMYRRFLLELRDMCPQLRVIGMSATPFRLDSGPLHKGADRLFTDIAHQVGIKELIEQGYLAPLVSAAVATRASTAGVAKRGGEFVPAALEAAVNRDDLTDPALDEVEELCADRKSWLVFCVGVEHARAVGENLTRRGYDTKVVTGETPKGQRDCAIAMFKAGNIRALVSVGVLTTGFDAPNADALICLRPTLSPGLWVQIVGRVGRLFPGKENGLVLDFTGNTAVHGPVDLIDIDGDGEVRLAPAKICEMCGAENEPGSNVCASCQHRFVKDCPKCMAPVEKEAAVCPECGHWFAVPRVANHETTASEGAIISGEDETEELEVADWCFSPHLKEGKPTSVRVDYEVGRMWPVSEWLCFDHGGFAAEKARSWWGGDDPPWCTSDALRQYGELECPKRIVVKRDGKFQRVVRRIYEP